MSIRLAAPISPASRHRVWREGSNNYGDGSGFCDPNALQAPPQPGEIAEYGGEAYGPHQNLGEARIAPSSYISVDGAHAIYDFNSVTGGKANNYKTITRLWGRPYCYGPD